jgi:hypothetical protein
MQDIVGLLPTGRHRWQRSLDKSAPVRAVHPTADPRIGRLGI